MNQVEQITIDLLHKMEIMPNLRGYRYSITAVQLIYENPNIIHAMTKELYPKVAELHEVKPNQIEHGIRNAHNLASHNDIRSLLHIKPELLTNSSFLAGIAEAVRIQIALEGTVDL